MKQRRAKEFAYELQDDLLEQINKLRAHSRGQGPAGHAAIENAKAEFNSLASVELFIVMIDRHAQQIQALEHIERDLTTIEYSVFFS